VTVDPVTFSTPSTFSQVSSPTPPGPLKNTIVVTQIASSASQPSTLTKSWTPSALVGSVSSAISSSLSTSTGSSSSPTPAILEWDYWKGTKWQKQAVTNKVRSVAVKREVSDGNTSSRTAVVYFSMVVGALVLVLL
jgi:hypothetical protein